MHSVVMLPAEKSFVFNFSLHDCKHKWECNFRTNYTSIAKLMKKSMNLFMFNHSNKV